MKASDELIAARDELYEAIKPALEQYERRTGLVITEVYIDRPIWTLGAADPEMRGIQVRTNASSL